MVKLKFTSEDIVSQSLVKSSVARGIRAKIAEQYPQLEADGVLDELVPKKANVIVVKCRDFVSLVSVENDIVFFQVDDGPFFPTLKVLHKYPTMMPHVQVDRGAIKFVLSGANIMCPGLTSAGGRLSEGIAKDAVVAVMAEGKTHALAIGKMIMSSDEIRKVNKGHGIENVHSLGDGLWKYVPEKSD